MTQALTNFALSLLHTLGYAGLFVLSMIESAGIPVPSEVVLPFSGFLVASGTFHFWPVVLIATIANYAGSVILYGIGLSGGRWILEHYGKYVLIRKHDIEAGDRWFNRHGVAAVFWGRMIPVVRTFISLPAGVNRMNFKKFSLFTVLGALPWNFVLAYIGVKTGEHWDGLHKYFHVIDIVLVILIVLGLGWLIYKRKFHAQ